ncbi:MAG: hypothetical protein JWL77_2942 [Chthonomonadaceae bacterium]|nr:hypothetical protein [Chthonomonadaceae bacterium]
MRYPCEPNHFIGGRCSRKIFGRLILPQGRKKRKQTDPEIPVETPCHGVQAGVELERAYSRQLRYNVRILRELLHFRDVCTGLCEKCNEVCPCA